MSLNYAVFYMNERSVEVLDECCEEQNEFYKLYTIFYQETKRVDPAIADIILEFEEKMTENLSCIEKVYRAGFKDGLTMANCSNPSI